MNDRDMSIAENDDIKLTKCKNFDGSYHAQAETREKESIFYTVEGCSVPQIMDVIDGGNMQRSEICQYARLGDI